MDRVLLHTTRTEVNCAVVASVPSQAVASRRYERVFLIVFLQRGGDLGSLDGPEFRFCLGELQQRM
jgi:hypothetical protein